MAEVKPEFPFIRCLTPEDEQRIKKIPFLNIDTVLIPSPYVKDKKIDKDYRHSYVWDEEGEILGYLVVYSNKKQTRFHIYTQVTSPFGRGKGIGSAFVEKLACEVPPESTIYLYVWEKLGSVVNFYGVRGFQYQETTVYRKMTFSMLSGQAQFIRDRMARLHGKDFSLAEELSRVRHDARKSLKVLLDMIGVISIDNFHKVVEDVNRETTALLNTLNVYEDKISETHRVDIKELVQERVIPVIEAGEIPCDVRLTLGGNVPEVSGNYMNYSRALINIVSNALDAIASADRRGLIDIVLRPDGEKVMLSIEDNGIGIEAERLKRGDDRLPQFVGKTTKEGEGLGTRQIFATFGPNNIVVESEPDRFTRWTIALPKATRRRTNLMAILESRYISLFKISQRVSVTQKSSRTQVAVFIWQLRQMEIFSYDLVNQFSRYNNVRDIYRTILLYRYGGKNWQFLKAELDKCRIDHQIFKVWLATILKRIKRNETFLAKKFDFEDYKGMQFKSYGQDIKHHIIFTIDPFSGRFFSCERKLAEHMDFVPYLGRERDELLRGEFIGDVKNLESPICLGVWSVTDRDDLLDKLPWLAEISDLTSISLDGRGRDRLVIPAFEKTVEEEELTISWGGLRSDTRFSKDLASLAGDIKLAGLQMTAKEGRLRWDGAQLDFDLNEAFPLVYLGSYQASSGPLEMDFNGPGKGRQELRVEGLEVDSLASQNGATVEYLQSLKVAKVEVNDAGYGPGELEVAVRGLDGEVLSQYQRDALGVYGQESFDPEVIGMQMMQVYLRLWSGLVKGSPEIEFRKLQFATPSGGFSGDLRLKLHGDENLAPGDVPALLEKLEGQAQLTADESLVRTVMTGMLAQEMKKAFQQQEMPQPSDEEIATMAGSQVEQQLEALIGQQFIERSDGKLRCKAVFEGGELKVNGQRLM